MAPIRFGVLGCAQIAYRSTIPALLECGDVELVAVASRTQEKADRFAAAGNCRGVVGYEALLEDTSIEAVYIPLPTGLHEQWVTRALQHGKHVLVEKSLALDYDSALRMVEMARSAKLILMENYAFGLHSQLAFLKEQMSSPQFGEYRLLRSSFGFPPLAADNFRYNRELGGGVLLDAAGYPLKLCQLLLGDELTLQTAQLVIDKEKGVDMYGSATISDKNGRSAQIAFGFDNFYQCTCELWGSRGKVSTGRVFTAPPQLTPLITVEDATGKQEHKLAPDNQFLRLIEHFHATLRGGNFNRAWNEVLNQARLLQDLKNLAENS